MPDEFKGIREAAEFWDKHSLADYEDLQTGVDVEVELTKEKNYFVLEKELSDIITEVARSKGVMPETLINLWLKKKVTEK